MNRAMIDLATQNTTQTCGR